MLQERNEQAPMSEEYPLMAFIAHQGVAPKGDRYDRSALVNDETGKKYKRTEFGDFIYSSNNLETGSIGLNKYGNASISPVYSIFKPTGKADLDFLGRRFLRKDVINEMVKWRQGVVYGQWKIHESDFLNIEIAVSSLDEQKTIGQHFNNIDNLITLHQCKCYCICGKVVFTWEQRKLDEEVEFYSGLTYSPDDVIDSEGTFVLRSSNVKNGEIVKADDVYVSSQIVNSNNVKRGDIIVVVRNGSRALIGKHAQIKEEMPNTVIGAFMTGIRAEQAEFINALLDTPAFDIEVKRNLGATINQITGYMFSKMEFLFPKDKEEQKRIGDCFTEIDNLITLHQREQFSIINALKYMIIQ